MELCFIADIEFKPDLVWPFTCKITATAISDDTNVIAVGLENGNIVVWDRYMGKKGLLAHLSRRLRDEPLVYQ